MLNLGDKWLSSAAGQEAAVRDLDVGRNHEHALHGHLLKDVSERRAGCSIDAARCNIAHPNRSVNRRCAGACLEDHEDMDALAGVRFEAGKGNDVPIGCIMDELKCRINLPVIRDREQLDTLRLALVE
ncbi:hypothetical protein [Propionibacterium sp. oral taxon 192]|uniref:hypothetical protein n=1 Tax=Propionibacterium sp. oral taxon 192 TaxID=671222 RepID=UPI0018DBF34C|nr:hypothetical protein [Propionibacterium sp. oral taxon 192]